MPRIPTIFNDNLVSEFGSILYKLAQDASLSPKEKIELINKMIDARLAEVAKMPVAQSKTPEQPSGKTPEQPSGKTPEQSQSSATQAATPSQAAETIAPYLNANPLPVNGQGSFNTLYIENAMNNFVGVLDGSAFWRRELADNIDALKYALSDVKSGAANFARLAGGRTQFSVSDDIREITDEIKYLFNPGQQSQSPGLASAMQAMSACMGIVNGVWNFYTILSRSSLHKQQDFAEKIDQQVLAARTLSAIFKRVYDQIQLELASATRTTYR